MYLLQARGVSVAALEQLGGMCIGYYSICVILLPVTCRVHVVLYCVVPQIYTTRGTCTLCGINYTITPSLTFLYI